MSVTADGLCIIDVLIKDSGPSANVSYSELRRAANLLRLHCVSGRSQGGISTGLGNVEELISIAACSIISNGPATLGDGQNVDLVMASYVPNVDCKNYPGPPTENCQTIVNSMPASKYQKSWGTAHAPLNADITLPRTLRESKSNLGKNQSYHQFAECFQIAGRKCMAIIETLGPTDVSSWYEIWQAVVALEGICVRNGLVGTARQRGMWLCILNHVCNKY